MLVAGQEPRQLARLERLGIDRDRRVVGPMHAQKNRLELLIAVDEDGFHGVSSLRGPRRRLRAQSHKPVITHGLTAEGGQECRKSSRTRSSSSRAAAAASAAASRSPSRARARRPCWPRRPSKISPPPPRRSPRSAPEPLTVAGDLRQLRGCEQVFKRVSERFKRCDVLVNNAGATRAGNFARAAGRCLARRLCAQVLRRGAVERACSGRCSRLRKATSSTSSAAPRAPSSRNS